MNALRVQSGSDLHGPDSQSASAQPRSLVRTSLSLVGRVCAGLACMVVIALVAVTAMRMTGTLNDVRVGAAHNALRWIGPVVLLVHGGLTGCIWWYWDPIVRSRRLALPTQEVLLSARNRLLFWSAGFWAFGAFYMLKA